MGKKLTVVLMLILMICITGCSNNTVSTDTKGNQKTEFTINEVANVNNTKIKINSVKKIYKECSWEFDGKCYSMNEPENDYFLLIDLTLENLGSEETSVSSMLQFDLKTPDGERASQELLLKSVKSTLDSSIMPNDLLKGQIAFDVTAADYYYFYYQDGILDDNIKFIINKNEISE